MVSLRKKITFIIINIVIIHLLYSKNKASYSAKSLSSIYFDFGGQSFIGSVNYDRKIYTNIFSLHIGIGALIPYSPHYTIPLGINYLIKLETYKYIEIGTGITPWLDMNDKIWRIGKDDHKINHNMWFGFRYQKSKSYFIKVGSALYPKEINKYIIIPGFSIGTAF